MKKILLSAIGLLGLTMSLFAQSPVIYEDEQIQIIDSVQASFEEIVDSVFAHVDLSQVPSGILIDKTLSTLDYSNFTGQLEMPDTEDLKQWRHLYNVFFRNANNEAQKWQADLQDSLSVMDNLIRERGLLDDSSTPTFCNLQVNDPQGWKAQYERVRANVLKAAEQYPPRLPRIRKWITHVDEVLQDIYAFETIDDFSVLNDSNKVDFLSWMQLYNLMNQAAIDPQQSPLPELEEVLGGNPLPPTPEEGQPIPLLFLDMHYHRIQPDAVEKNLLRFNGIQLHDVAGRNESPYEVMALLAATPAALRLESASPSFIIRPELILGNRQKGIKNISIDFGDGTGFREVYFNELISIQYAEGGEKRMIFKVTYEDCSFALNHAVVTVAEESVANGRTQRTKNLVGIADVEFPIRAERHYEGGFASGRVSIEYGCGNDRLMKPFIIVEGFNPEQFEVFEQASFYLQFLDKINEENEPLRIALQNSGYDLVYLDYDDGGTYIQRNAYLLQTLIKRVNAMKEANGSTEPNVIMGTSMGGLVIRYALAEMERPRDGRSPEDHDTRLYISFDSPHQGANVPLGFQHAAYHLPQVRFGGKTVQQHYEELPLSLFDIPSPDIGVQMMETPAARQMLIRQAITTYDKRLVNNNPYHEEFMREYRELDYPTQCRNVAISNGSQIGRGQNFDPGSLLLGLQSNGFNASVQGVEALWDFLGFNDAPPILGGPASVLTAAVVLPVVNIIAGYKVNLKVWSLEDHSNEWQTVYRGHISGRILLVPIAFSTFKARVKQLPALDSAPGGRIDYAGDVAHSDFFDLNVGEGSFCLVPTVSALDLREPDNEDLYLNVQERDIIANARTAFLDYDAPDAPFTLPDGRTLDNEFHTTFTGFNARLFQQYLIGADLPDNLLTSEYYNFGAGSTLSTTDRMGDVILNSGGQLLVNANLPIGPAEDAGENPPPFPNSTFEVQVSPAANCAFQNGEVEVRAGGEIILGEISPNNRGIMRFRQGSTLILESGSRLVIRENSQLIIECGATLIFEEGATIETEGDDARLTIDGTLQLPEGADFPYAYNTGNSSSPDVANITIEGSGLVCTEGTTFELSDVPEGTEVCWSVTGDHLFIEGEQCGNTVFVKASPNAISEAGTLQASVRYVGACDDIAPSTIALDLSIGPIASTDISITGGADALCPDTYYTFQATPNIEGDYEWDATGLGTIIDTHKNSVYLLTNDDPSNGALAVQINNGCGLSGSIDKTYSTCEGLTLSAYPMPANGYLNIAVEENEQTVTDTEPYELSIYDDQGVLTRQQWFTSKKFKMDISDLPSKVYYLQLKHKEKQANKKIIVKN